MFIQDKSETHKKNTNQRTPTSPFETATSTERATLKHMVQGIDFPLDTQNQRSLLLVLCRGGRLGDIALSLPAHRPVH